MALSEQFRQIGGSLKQQNSPLRISSPASSRNIGLSICPGKVDPWAYSGPCHRNLGEDLNIIKKWGARRIVTLLEKEELEYLQVVNLGAEAEKIGLIWHHWNVIDGSALRTRQPVSNDPWRQECSQFIRELQGGNKIFIHCRGGLGRTGTLAARLLIDMGFSPVDAVKEVRAARPGAIETAEQENYLLTKAWQHVIEVNQ